MDFDPAILRNGLILFFLLASSLCLRAYAQAWVATKLGDRTPASEGRLTLNPVPHVDILGTIVLPLIFIFYLSPSLDRQNLTFFLGWAKPVPINPHSFKNPRRDAVLVQFAGLAMSLVLLTFAAVAGGLLYRFDEQVVQIFFGLISINSCLVVFDCLPIPPLPGGVLLRHLGYISEERYNHLARWGGLILLILINLKPTAMVFGMLRAVVATPFAMIMEGIAL
jgi:Zn-dependent protease